MYEIEYQDMHFGMKTFIMVWLYSGNNLKNINTIK